MIVSAARAWVIGAYCRRQQERRADPEACRRLLRRLTDASSAPPLRLSQRPAPGSLRPSHRVAVAWSLGEYHRRVGKPTDAAVRFTPGRRALNLGERRVLSLAYFSNATPSAVELELSSILSVSQRNNSAVGVTGLLCHIDGSFLQFLEGEEVVVRETFARISRDARHAGLIKVHDAEITRRAFGEWSMGLVNLDEVDAQHQAFCQGLRAVEIAPNAEHREAFEGLLKVFRAWLR